MKSLVVVGVSLGAGFVLCLPAGLTSAEPAPSPGVSDSDQARHFDAEIAPLLARHCFECHDSTVKKGGLDLSSRGSMFEVRGGLAAVVPGDAEASLLWDTIEAGDMPPPPRPGLTEDEKKLLRAWIEDVHSSEVFGPPRPRPPPPTEARSQFTR